MKTYKQGVALLVMLVLLGTLAVPVIASSNTERQVPVKAYGSDGSSTEKQLSYSDVRTISAFLHELEQNPEDYTDILPVLLAKLEQTGLVEDAACLYETISGQVKKPASQQVDVMANAYCFVLGRSTNSAVFGPLSMAAVGTVKVMLFMLQLYPVLYTLFYGLSQVTLDVLLYPPRLYLPFATWNIGWDGHVSTLGLLGYKSSDIDGGKWGKTFLLIGFTGLLLTLPMGGGYDRNWFIGSSALIVGRT
ncbi:MAG: hypothetical protein ACP5FL_05665 [Thermoplasmatota archaeon]